MELPFFVNRIYFETSFELPSGILKRNLQNAIDKATSSKFRIFLSRIDEINCCIKEGYEKAVLELEDIKGETIQAIHQSIIDLCRDDHENAFRAFFAVDAKEQHYLVIHAHHGVADGFMITSFIQDVYSTCYEKEEFPLQFVNHKAILKTDNFQFPSTWNLNEIQKNVKETISKMESSTSFPYHENQEKHNFINISRIIDADTSKRASVTAKNYGALHQLNSCIHGMLLECYLRSVVAEERLTEGTISINTITNLRRYLKPSTESPSLFVASFPTTVSIPSLLSRDENCATIQKKVSSSLEDGLPLAFYLQDEVSASKEQRVEMEMSNLGLHPSNCFTRCLITQIIYENRGVSTMSVVVWMDTEKRLHLCGACDESFLSEDRFKRIMDGFVGQVHEFGAVYLVSSNKQC